MDKRLFLAFALSGAVVVATPLLFPAPKKAPAPAAPVAANAAAPTASPAVAPGAPSSASPAPIAAGAPAPTAAPVAAPIVAETITVNDARRHTTFSSLGAAPINVEVIGYKRLGAKVAGPVNIHQAREALLRYRVLAGRDTIDLSTVPFTTVRSTSTTGATVVRFTGTAMASTGPATVAFEYALQANDFTGQVQATVTGLTVPAFLLVDLPTGFVSQEADTSADLMALSYAAKPQKGGAKGMPFSKLDPGEQKLEAGPMLWAVAKNKYFIVALLTNEKAPTIAEVHYEGGTRVQKQATRGHATAVLPLTDGTTRFELYTGPQEWKRMRAMGRDFENANPYGGFMQGIVQPFATIVMRVLLWMKASTQLNYGWVLVIFGVGIRLLMWPLNQKAMRSSMQLQRIQPEMQALQARYKSDPQKQQQEIMKLYADHGMSPLSPLLGCLPMLLPMPILFALFFVFQNTIEFRGVPFLWLTDISMKDPYYILPLVMGASMYVLSWIGMRNAPPNPQAKMMAYVMPAMMTVFLLTFASGLNLYYTVQNLAALPQQWLIANERAKIGKKG